jgi:hypothetical protein
MKVLGGLAPFLILRLFAMEANLYMDTHHVVLLATSASSIHSAISRMNYTAQVGFIFVAVLTPACRILPARHIAVSPEYLVRQGGRAN